MRKVEGTYCWKCVNRRAQSRPLSSIALSVSETGAAERSAAAEGFDAGVKFDADERVRCWSAAKAPYGGSFQCNREAPRADVIAMRLEQQGCASA
jgi:hypothetical protein